MMVVYVLVRTEFTLLSNPPIGATADEVVLVRTEFTLLSNGVEHIYTKYEF